MVRIRFRGTANSKFPYHYFYGHVLKFDRETNIYTVECRHLDERNNLSENRIRNKGFTLDIDGRTNIHQIYDLDVGDEVLSTSYTLGTRWCRKYADDDSIECVVKKIRVPLALQNRWCKLPLSYQSKKAQIEASIRSKSDTKNSIRTNMVKAKRVSKLESINYDFDVELLGTGEIIKHCDPMSICLPQPGARAVIQVGGSLKTCVIAQVIPYDKPNGNVQSDQNEIVDFSLQVAEDLIPPLEIPKIEIPPLNEMLDLNLEDEDENQNKMPEESIRKPIPRYHYRVQFDGMNLRNELNVDSNHRFNALQVFGSEPCILRNNFLSEFQKKKLQDVAILLIVHPFGVKHSDAFDCNLDEDVKCKGTSNEFLLHLKHQMWENKIEYKGNYNLDIDTREYQQNDIVLHRGKYYYLNKKTEDKLRSEPQSSKSHWKELEAPVRKTWVESKSSPTQKKKVNVTLQGPYFCNMPSLFGDMADYDVEAGRKSQNSSSIGTTDSYYKRYKRIELEGGRPMLDFQVWEVFVDNDERQVGKSDASSERFIKSIVEGAECIITSVDEKNTDSVKKSMRSMSKVRNLGKHKCLYFDTDKKCEVPVTPENLATMKQFVNERDLNGRYINVKWRHSDGDLVPMICFVQKPLFEQEICAINDEDYDDVFQTFLRIQGSGNFRDGYCVRVEDHLWQWDTGYSFRLLDEESTDISRFNSSFYNHYENLDSSYMSFVAFCALRRMVGICRQLSPNIRTTTWNSIFVLEGGEKVWSRTLSLVTPHAISHLKIGMKGRVLRKQFGTILMVNDGTYDVKRDTAKSLRAIEEGKDIGKVITVPAEDVEAVKVPEAKEYDKSSLVELFLQCRSIISTLNLNYTDIGNHGAKALQVLLTGITGMVNDEPIDENDVQVKKEAFMQKYVKAFYRKYSTLKSPILDKFLKPQPLLTTLSLRACSLGVDGVDSLSKGLFSNETLTSLDLGANNLGDAGVAKLSAVLYNQPSLKHLDLRGNAITGIGAQMLAKNIAQYHIGIVKGMLRP